MQLVRAALGYGIDDGSGGAAVFGGEVRDVDLENGRRSFQEWAGRDNQKSGRALSPHEHWSECHFLTSRYHCGHKRTSAAMQTILMENLMEGFQLSPNC
jgi:hypothetical protein